MAQEENKKNEIRFVLNQNNSSSNTPPIKTEEKSDESYPEPNVEIPHLRTYKQDIKEVVEGQNMSSTRILLEEQRRKAGQVLAEESTTLASTHNKWLLALSLILLISAVGILTFLFINPPSNNTPSRITIERPNFISIEEQVLIPTEFRNKRDVYTDVEQSLTELIVEDEIREILFTKTRTEVEVEGDTTRQVTEILTSAEFFSLLESRASGTFLRSIDSTFMFGVFGINVAKPFLIFRINNFENVFSEMLQWEPILAHDMQPIFFLNYAKEELARSPDESASETEESILENDEQITTSTTSTSTPPVVNFVNESPQLRFDPTTFSDQIIANQDARVIKNEFGDILFFYTIINNEYLVMTGSEKTLVEIQRRIRQAGLIR